MSAGMLTFLMLAVLIAIILLNFPIGLSLAAVATIFGVIFVGPQIGATFMLRMHVTFSDYILVAIPLFIFMGVIVEKSGLATRLYDAMFVLFGGLRGGLAVATILACTVFAASTGVVGATVVTMGMMSLPSMMKYEYDKVMVAGSICAGGALGILIPPSIMILVYAPTAGVSVGKMLIGAFVPGFILSLCYIAYILVRCYVNPKMGPAIEKELLDKYSLADKIKMLFVSVVPVCAIILAVLGSIFFGIASPTEAAAVGAFAACLLALAYKGLTWKSIKEACINTVTTTAMVLCVMVGAAFFTSVFMRLGCGQVVEDVLMGLPGGKWGILAVMWAIIFLMGAFIDWIGIVMICVPLFTPIAVELGFDPVWFSIMNCVVMQTSFLTPPFAYSIFYLKGIAPPGMTLTHIYKGVVPFIIIILIVSVFLTIFPDIVMWMPNKFTG
ncbi:MAG: TRAP transporter large permease subunit [Clostridia bacterium]|nr:TRAP transporter large permease subunit [Clostridia bacterium]